MAVPSPVGDVKLVSSISTFVLNTLTLKKVHFFRCHFIMVMKSRLRNDYHSVTGSAFNSYAFACFVLLVCRWRHGDHVGGQEEKHFSSLGAKLYFHVNFSRKHSIALTPNMAGLSRGCKSRTCQSALCNQRIPSYSFFYKNKRQLNSGYRTD